MWIVRLALSRPYTFVVMGLVILLLGGLAVVTTPTDIFPEIDTPVVSAPDGLKEGTRVVIAGARGEPTRAR